jgi:hypothetical protein
VRPWIWPACEPAEGRCEGGPNPAAVALWNALEAAAASGAENSAGEPRRGRRKRERKPTATNDAVEKREPNSTAENSAVGKREPVE